MVATSSFVPIIIGLATGIAFIVMFSVFSSHVVRFGKHITANDAVSIAKQQYRFLQNEGDLKPNFGILKYEGVATGEGLRYSWYAADSTSGTVKDLLHSKIIIFPHNGIGLPNSDRYVWTVSYFIPTSGHIIFIDAQVGKIIGEWVPCPECVCDHDGIMYK